MHYSTLTSNNSETPSQFKMMEQTASFQKMLTNLNLTNTSYQGARGFWRLFCLYSGISSSSRVYFVPVQFIAEEVREFASNTSSLVGEQYKKVAELLTGKDIRTARVVGLLADAWQSLSDKHSWVCPSSGRLWNRFCLIQYYFIVSCCGRDSPSSPLTKGEVDYPPPTGVCSMESTWILWWNHCA